MSKKSIFLSVYFLSCLAFANAQPFVRGEIIVMLETGARWEEVEQKALNEFLKADFFKNFEKNKQKIQTGEKWLTLEKVVSETMNIFLVRTHPALDEQKIAAQLATSKLVRAAQLNYYGNFRQQPNDDRYGLQWNVRKIKADAAWTSTTSGTTANGDTIVVFVIDEGTHTQHEDLQQNIWWNRNELPNNGIDEDGNGYVDDVQGWNLSAASGVHAPLLHGTAVAGIIAARGNNGTGTAGVSWAAKILPFSIAADELTVANLLQGYDYALAMRQRYDNSGGTEGAFIVTTNLSAGFDRAFPQNFAVFCEVFNILGENGMLNISAAAGGITNNVERNGDIPTLCSSDFLIAVTNTDSTDTRRSSYGRTSIDLAAPGTSCYTTLPFDDYGYFGGTSCAAPHVTGAVALLFGLDNAAFATDFKENPTKVLRLLKTILLENTDKIAGLDTATVSGGRLNLENALQALTQYYGGWDENFEILNLYPNPASEAFWVEYEMPATDFFEVVLYNQLGQTVWATTQAAAEMGFKKLKISVSELSAGVYFLQIKNGQQSKLRKIVVF